MRRTFLKGTTVAALGSLIGGTAIAEENDDTAETDASNYNLSNSNSPILAAHRGFQDVSPENTVAAVKKAVSGGKGDNAANRRCDMIECDIVPAGGQPWKGEEFDLAVFHDDKLASRDGGERGTTDAPNQYVWETDSNVVFNAEVLESGETIPRLEEVVEATPDDIPLNIEWKAAGRLQMPDDFEEQKETWRSFTKQALDILSEYPHDFIVQPFSKAALATVREEDSSIPIAYLLWDSIEDGLQVSRDLDCEYVQPPYNRSREHRFSGMNTISMVVIGPTSIWSKSLTGKVVRSSHTR
ncbi:glycerophosphodiester phosphodiesterase family protein [Haladaptatus halobius]|uniref:glycerophosphodiester phosphodiesterase family protein n=1 Tax=Haladaptatus halobius TaxID=2884875 RepID=UPI001D0B3C81|nr:glycerophosphodiester phosphodiesterase family protein [Haladaptatus halobius]